MDSQSEGSMSVFGPIDQNTISLWKDLRITVGRRKGQQHHFAFLERAAADCCLLGDLASHRHRGIGPQKLFYRKRHECRLSDQPTTVIAVLGQMP